MLGAGLWVQKPGTRTRSSQGASWFYMASRHVGGQAVVVKSRRDLTVTESPPIFTRTGPAAEQVELGSLIKLTCLFHLLDIGLSRRLFFFL